VTTQEFLKYFGINRIPEDLPRLREFSELLEAGALVPQYSKSDNAPEEPTPLEESTDQIELSMGDA
jgi:segregation and condensation protein B